MSTNQTCALRASMRAAEGFRRPYTFVQRLPVTRAKDYSYLKATIGSTRMARRAGM
jgi:hypothetical protein